MSEYFNRHSRYEPLSEFHFNIDELYYDYENYFYCVCSRIFIRDAVKISYNEREDASESDADVVPDQTQVIEDQSHVHFSVDISDKKDEGTSCYCSASHTDNYCSTDEHDPAQLHGTMSHALQPSDSGADLTYQDCHSDHTSHDKLEKMDQDFPKLSSLDNDENYLSEDTWEKFWAINGERLIWASWIKKYSDYINPAYLDENNDLIMDEHNIPTKHSSDNLFDLEQTDLDIQQKNVTVEENIRERKFSYDSKVNPYKKSNSNRNPIEKSNKSNELICNKDDAWLPIGRRRSCSEHDRMLSPRTLATTDSMTNVTKITLSSYDATSSPVTSESTPTDDYSVSSSSSDDPSNDQTRIANIDENTAQLPSEELDNEEYWQFLWKKHFGEQYAMHYANYVEAHNWRYADHVEETENAETKDPSLINVEMFAEKKTDEKILEVECENSEGNSQEMPSVIEVQSQVDKVNLDQKVTKSRKRNKKITNNYIRSVGVLLQNLLMEEQKNSNQNEVVDAEETSTDKTQQEKIAVDTTDGNMESLNVRESGSNSNYSSYMYDEEEDDDPPEETPISIKRSHELDYEEVTAEKIKATFEIMGFCLDPDNMPKGKLIYRKRITRLRPPRYKRFGAPKKTYFDDDGNPYGIDQIFQAQEAQEREMQTDEDCPEVKLDTEKSPVHVTCRDEAEVTSVLYDVQNRESFCDNETSDKDVTCEAAGVPFPSDIDSSFSDIQDSKQKEMRSEEFQKEGTVQSLESSVDINRRRRSKRYDALCENRSEMPPELQGDNRMGKYWKRRHSLFHRFDEGIKLDHESWFSVTPESVAAHIATKCGADVVLDAFCGAGGNTIQFAMTSQKVIAIDIDPVKIEMAKHNARVYGVAEKIEFLVGDFFELASAVAADVVFLSPPWGGPDYNEKRHYNIENMLKPRPASDLMRVAQEISSRVIMYLPRSSNTDQLLQIAKEHHSSVEIEQSFLDKRFVAITAYFYK